MLGKLPFTRSSTTAVLIERDGRFFAYEPDLGIVASAETVEGAYQRFVAARKDFMEVAERAGLALDQPAVADGPAFVAGRSVAAELAMFFAKTCIVLIVVGAVISLAALGVSNAIGRLAANVGQSMKPITMADVSDKAADIARDMLSMSDEKKETLKQSVGVISRELTPVIDAWRNPPPK